MKSGRAGGSSGESRVYSPPLFMIDAQVSCLADKAGLSLSLGYADEQIEI